jgi:hypothetical protein
LPLSTSESPKTKKARAASAILVLKLPNVIAIMKTILEQRSNILAMDI